MKEIEIIIPIFNDFESLEVLLSRISEVESSNIKFLIVDNGSTDPRVMQLLKNLSDKYRSISLANNAGFGGGILSGIRNSNSEWVGWMPGNLKIDPRDIPIFVKDFSYAPTSLLKATRIGRSTTANFKTFLAGFIQSILLKKKMLDTGGTPTICHRDFILSLQNPPTSYVFESFILYMARKKRITVIRPKIHYGQRLFGTSHWQNGLNAEFKLMREILVSSKHWKLR